MVDPANLDTCGERVDNIETETGSTGPWLADVAEAWPVVNCGGQQICVSPSRRWKAGIENGWRIDHEAVVDHLVPGTEAPLEASTPAKACVIGDIETIPHVAQVSVVRRLRNQVVNQTELRGLDIGIATELLAADIARQSRILRRRDAERIVTTRLSIARKPPYEVRK